MSVDCGRHKTLGNLRAGRPSMTKVAAQHASITERPAQDVFHLSSNIEWSTILHNIVLSRRCLSSRQEIMQFCNISANLSTVTLTVSKTESRIYSKKRPDNGTCGKSATRWDFLVGQWSLYESSGIFRSPNSAAVGVDRSSKCEMVFVGPHMLDNLHLPLSFEIPTSQILSASENCWATVHDDAKFYMDSMEGTP